MYNQPAFRVPIGLIGNAIGVSKPSQLDGRSLRMLADLTHELASLALSPQWPGDALYAVTPFWSSLTGLSQDTIPSEPVAWEIIHPGWRFIKIKRAIQGDRITLSDISDAGEITRHIAKKLGWVEPKKAADELLDSCKKDELKSYIMKDFIEAVEDINELRLPMRSPYDRHRALLVSPLRRMSRGPNRSDRFARYAVAVWEVTT